MLYDQHGSTLVARRGEWRAPASDANGQHEHAVRAEVREAQHFLDDGGVALGAFADGRMVGIGIVVPHLRPGIAQLAFLHVSAPWRDTGIGRRLCDRLEQVARPSGDAYLVVSAPPSENTLRFYLGRGFEPTADALAELLAVEPEDVHMRKAL